MYSALSGTQHIGGENKILASFHFSLCPNCIIGPACHGSLRHCQLASLVARGVNAFTGATVRFLMNPKLHLPFSFGSMCQWISK